MDGDWLLVEGRPLLTEEGGVGSHQTLLRVLAMHHQTLSMGTKYCTLCIHIMPSFKTAYVYSHVLLVRTVSHVYTYIHYQDTGRRNECACTM